MDNEWYLCIPPRLAPNGEALRIELPTVEALERLKEANFGRPDMRAWLVLTLEEPLPSPGDDVYGLDRWRSDLGTTRARCRWNESHTLRYSPEHARLNLTDPVPGRRPDQGIRILSAERELILGREGEQRLCFFVKMPLGTARSTTEIVCAYGINLPALGETPIGVKILDHAAFLAVLTTSLIQLRHHSRSGEFTVDCPQAIPYVSAGCVAHHPDAEAHLHVRHDVNNHSRFLDRRHAPAPVYCEVTIWSIREYRDHEVARAFPEDYEKLLRSGCTHVIARVHTATDPNEARTCNVVADVLEPTTVTS